MSWNSKTWAWVKKYFSVNPASTNGMPVVGQFRTPAVGSRPEKYIYPKTPNSNIYNNPYWKRDTRRNFPRLAVYTQHDVALLLEGGVVKPSPAVGSIASPADEAVTTAQAKPLTELLNSQALYSADKLPPQPRFGAQHQWKISQDFVPPNDGSYFPMRVFT